MIDTAMHLFRTFRVFRRSLIALGLALMTSCTTRALWDMTEAYVMVQPSDIDEAALKAEGIRYYRDDQFDVYFVQKGALERYGNYALRTFGTPVTVTVDASVTILIVGGAIYLTSISNGTADPFAILEAVYYLMAQDEEPRRPVPSR
jgi:hypothetical protein